MARTPELFSAGAPFIRTTSVVSSYPYQVTAFAGTWRWAVADAIVYWTGLEKTASAALEPISPAARKQTQPFSFLFSVWPKAQDSSVSEREREREGALTHWSSSYTTAALTAAAAVRVFFSKYANNTQRTTNSFASESFSLPLNHHHHRRRRRRGSRSK